MISASSGPAAADVITWIAGAGDWFTGTNWDAGVPGSTDEAFIRNGGVAAAADAIVEANDLNIGLRSDGTLAAPHGVGTLNATNANISVGNDLNVGVTDAGAGALGASNGTLTTVGGAAADGDVSVVGKAAIGRFVDGPAGTATAVVDIQTGSFLGGNELYVGMSENDGAADGTLNVAGDLNGFTVSEIGRVRLGGNGDATGRVNVQGGILVGSVSSFIRVGASDGPGKGDGALTVTNDVDGSNSVLVGMANRAGDAKGVLDVGGAVIGAGGFNQFTLGTGSAAGHGDGMAMVGNGVRGFEDANIGVVMPGGTGSATGRVDIAAGGLQIDRTLNVGLTWDEGTADGTVIVEGGVSGLNSPLNIVEIGRVRLGAAGDATGRVTILSGDLTLGTSSFIKVGASDGPGKGDGILTVAGNMMGTGEVLIGQAVRLGDATGVLTVNGALVGVASPSQFDRLRIGETQFAGIGDGTATVGNGVSGFYSVEIGIAGPTAENAAIGALTLNGGTLAATDLIVGVSEGTATATGRLNLNDNLAILDGTMTLGDGATLQLGIDGLLRGTDYGAFDATMAMLDGDLDVVFGLPVVSGIFDLIVTRAINSILGDFASVNVDGLASGTLFSAGIEQVDFGNGLVDVYRVRVGEDAQGGVPEPYTLWLLAIGLVFLWANRRKVLMH